jgi:hypothetical protein
MISKISFIITTFFVLINFLLSGCSESESASNLEIMHPIEEKIPHYNHDHLLVEKNGQWENLQNVSGIINGLGTYLNDPQQVQSERLDVLIGSGVLGLHVVAIDTNRLVLLDADRDHLFEYDLSSHNKTTLAETGRGPGDIQFAREMMKNDEHVFIVREDMYISVYDCSATPCKFEEALSVDFRPVSLTLTNNHFAVLGFPGQNRPQSQSEDEETDTFSPVRLLDYRGEKEAAFGEMYDIEGQMILVQPFVSNGMIRYSPNNHLFILAYPRFPFLYIYDADNLKLKEVYRISDFTIGQQSYRPDERSIAVIRNDYSEIRNVSVIYGNLLLIETVTLRNFNNVVGPEKRWDRWSDYYIINLEDQESYYLGSYENVGDTPWQYVHISEYGLMIYDDADGSLEWIGNL